MKYMNEILIVDDDEDIRVLIRRYLAELDVELHFVSSGEKGIEKYEELVEKGKTPIMVIMDLRLPGINGVEATKEIMKIDENANVYGFTAHLDTKWVEELKNAGAKDVIGRPLGMDGFRDRIKKVLEEQYKKIESITNEDYINMITTHNASKMIK